MLRSSYFFLAFTILITSCSNNKHRKKLDEGFVVSINFDHTYNSWVYLHQIELGEITVIDSCLIQNSLAEFKGTVAFPKRYLITIENEIGKKILILENDSLQLSILKNDLHSSVVTGSFLNDELLHHQQKIERNFKKIDALFPDLQRARLANNAEKLSEIAAKIKAIEIEALEINYEYASSNPDSFLSPMILNDLSKRDTVNLIRIQTLFNSLSRDVKKSDDSKELEQFLANNYK